MQLQLGKSHIIVELYWTWNYITITEPKNRISWCDKSWAP